MKIGIIVDGDAESQALFNLVKNISIENVQIIKPIYADIQPKATSKQIAKKTLDKINFLRGKDAERILILVDREDLDKCPNEIKNDLMDAYKTIDCKEVDVIIKNRKFENWLVSDIDALKNIKVRFKVTKSFQSQVKPNKADNIIDAESHLNTIVSPKNVKYHKRKDAIVITEKQDVLRMACNSRSFRRFLRLLNHPEYKKQSKKPHKNCS